MIVRSRRALTLCTLACLILALATVGGYRLARSSSPGPRHLRLAIGGNANTWVASTGSNLNEGNPNYCGRLNPCAGFGTALLDTTSGGVIAAADHGSFGPAILSQAVTIDGGPGKGLILTAGNGVYVGAGPSDVVILRHLQINGVGIGAAGIRFVSGKALILDDVTIEDFSGPGISVEVPGATVTITNSHIQNNGKAGIAITPAGGKVQVSISHTTIANNYFGLIAQDGADVSLTDSVVTGSTDVGVGCQTYGGGPCTIQTAHDRIDHNWAAVWMNHASGNAQITETLEDNDVFGNTYGIYGDFGGTLNAATFGNNRFANNFVDGAASSTMTLK